MGDAAAERNRPGSRRGEGEGRRPSCLRPLALCIALAFPLISLTGCGLETVTYYSPPGFLYGGNILTLTHNSGNSDANFLGYDIYYRAYSNLTDADAARLAIENATNLTSSTPESILSQLTSALSFKKIYAAANPTVSPTPLLKNASIYTFQLPNSSSSTNWYYTTDLDPATPVQIVRGTGVSPGMSFNYPYTVGDIDYATPATNAGVGLGQPVFIVAFAVAYGYDFTKLTSIYSFPASLYQTIGGSTGGYILPSL
jgi:hypothetical protein